MSLKKLAPVVICILIFLVSSFYTPAEQTDWNKDMNAASAARQRGEYTLAETSINRPSRYRREIWVLKMWR